ncbi:MAG: bifunctional phosphoribosyl-AMP cyclohydrolase/phosphoribosyl-ATP diphosphatase HisIE [Steroidobacteraceae bacterium]|jgi:phosphoribosyl-ATP pyrophosphohydrolase/phosphoribosyl-AMP cyclohydrolase|nr:bifunctional phosphoribosyl-AMP cyclohydrolase/phosphoribosyl-ATP diphosphatase HisIE [Steroidobacteraceae bacterium]
MEEPVVTLLDREAVEGLDFAKGAGLLPAIVQHVDTGAVLMLGWMNADAVRETLRRGRVVFWSRSKQRLWEKGESSGHVLEVAGAAVDCDRDTLLWLARPRGPVCHLQTLTCFGDERRSGAESLAFLGELERVIEARIAAGEDRSYTARLYAAGTRRIAQKVGEEGVETALAAVAEDDAKLVGESADLLFHLAVLLKARGLSLQAVVAELESRHAARGAPPG